MSRTIYKLTATKVRQATAPGLHGDGGALYMQVSKTGAKSWIFRYDFDGKRHEMGLGSCQTVDLAEAREAARACRQALRDKRDPLAERKAVHTERALARAKRITFDQCASAYIAAHRSS